MVTGVTNDGMDSTPAAKSEAKDLCKDAVNYISNNGHDGISGTNGQKETVRDGTAVWADETGKKKIEFTFTEDEN